MYFFQTAPTSDWWKALLVTLTESPMTVTKGCDRRDQGGREAWGVLGHSTANNNIQELSVETNNPPREPEQSPKWRWQVND